MASGTLSQLSSFADDGSVMPPPLEMPASAYEVYVTWVDGPHNFRCIPQVFVEPRSHLTASMHTLYEEQSGEHESYGVSLDSVCEGELYGGWYKTMWYRVTVKKIIMKKVAVRFVDCGNFAVIPFHSLRVLPSQFRKLPFLAINARLTGVARDGHHSPAGIYERFSELVLERKLTAWIHASEGDEYVSMTLMDRSKRPDGPDQFIHDVLINEKLAVKSQYDPPSQVPNVA